MMRPTWNRRRWLVFTGLIAMASAVRCDAVQNVLDPSNTISIGAAAARFGERVTKAAEAEKPTLLVLETIEEVNPTTNYQRVSLLLVNPLDVPITYHGYRMDGWDKRPPTGEISPFYTTELREKPNGGWKPNPIGWCGSGAGQMTIPPKQAGCFDAMFYLPAVAGRIGVNYRTPNQDEKSFMTVWSPEIALELRP